MRFFTMLAGALALRAAAEEAQKPMGERFDRFHGHGKLLAAPNQLDDTSYRALTRAPRDYSVAVLLTALDARFGCQLCREFQPEWDLLGRVWAKGDADGLARMVRHEGALSCFRGWLPNSSRAAVMTAGQLATYDAFKRALIRYTPLGDTLTTHLSASFLAGLAAATATSPIDVIKTRVMSSTQNQGVLRLVADIYRTDGIGWMFKGWVPSFLRLGPHTICTFVFLEMHRKAYRKLKGLDDSGL
ncbi:hypothetical protein CDD83_7764 [Cordyceps sp. RAO-2017]|nr:hypothetical protein CDD83_7764 [Cordyceps sp. RAO-2017]